MSAVFDMMLDMWGYWVAGAMVGGVGGLLVWGSRKAEPDSRKVTRWIGFPTIGCGVLLFVVPFFAVSSALLLLFGFIAACEHMTGC